MLDPGFHPRITRRRVPAFRGRLSDGQNSIFSQLPSYRYRELSRSIYSKTGLGIDLLANGVNANNGTKNVVRANSGMDHPVFASAVLADTTLTVTGYVGSAANQSTFASARVEIFKSDNDATGYGEGQTYLGFLTSEANGNFSGSVTLSSSLTPGDKITGTANDGSNNTDESS